MDRINICFSINDKYTKHCGVVISSILENIDPNRRIAFYILHSKLNKLNKFLLKKVVNNRAEIEFAKVDESLFKDCKTPPKSHFRKENYFRLKISSILNKLNKALYLDSDTIVIKDISKLYDIDISNYYLACIEDTDEFIKQRWMNNGFTCKDNYRYYNSGVLLLNLKKWREDNLENKLMHLLATSKAYFRWVDQDALNAIVNYDLKYLEDGWNFMLRLSGGYTKKHREIVENYNKEDIKILHYATKCKPWVMLKKDYYSNFYFEYLKLTPWQKFEWFYELKRKLKLKKLELEKKNKPKKDVEKLNNFTKDKKVILWGASLFLKDLINTNKLNYTNILGVVDKNPDLKGQKIGKTKIISLEDIATLNPDCIISTAIKHPKLDKIIEEELKEKNINIPVEKKFFKPIKEEILL